MKKRTHKQEKLARIYDDEILPLWSQRFGRMMLRGLELPAKAMVLDVACGSGYTALEVLRKMDDQSRLIAIDSSPSMLDLARKKAGELGGKRIFFRTESAAPKLPFTAEVFDLVLCNLGILELPDARAALRDFARVTKVGGQVLATLPLAGTFAEFHDIFHEVLVKHDKTEMLERLERYLESYPDAEEAEGWLVDAGLESPRVDVEEFTLLFRSSREFFFAPVIEYGPLPRWKEIAGKGQELQDVFWYIKQAIDAYFGDRAFQVTVKAGCLHGSKRAPHEEVITGPFERPSVDEISGEWLPVPTSDLEVVEEAVEDDEDEDDDSLDALRDDLPPRRES